MLLRGEQIAEPGGQRAAFSHQPVGRTDHSGEELPRPLRAGDDGREGGGNLPAERRDDPPRFEPEVAKKEIHVVACNEVPSHRPVILVARLLPVPADRNPERAQRSAFPEGMSDVGAGPTAMLYPRSAMRRQNSVSTQSMKSLSSNRPHSRRHSALIRKPDWMASRTIPRPSAV